MAELKESQNGVHAVSFPLKGLIVSLGNLTFWLCVDVGAAAVGSGPVEVGVGGGAGAVAFSIRMRVE